MGSPVAARIRARLSEIGLSESDVSRSWGRDRTVLSTQLRRLDEGGHLRDDTLARLEVVLGKPTHWILTGEEIEGVRLDVCAAWPEAARQARERYGMSADTLMRVGSVRVPMTPRHLDAALLRALADAL